jgi:hypothetical protein
MRNLTITVDDEVARWARVWAARQEKSLSRAVGELLRQRMREEEGYGRAMKRFLSRPAARLRKGKSRYPTREELHDRAGLR